MASIVRRRLRSVNSSVQTLKAHFDGTSIVLDEPATLTVGQAVQVVVETMPTEHVTPRQPRFGFGKGMFNITMRDDFNDPLDAFMEYR